MSSNIAETRATAHLLNCTESDHRMLMISMRKLVRFLVGLTPYLSLPFSTPRLFRLSLPLLLLPVLPLAPSPLRKLKKDLQQELTEASAIGAGLSLMAALVRALHLALPWHISLGHSLYAARH